ncbi:MAG: hypothetical protein AB1730_15165 [Myxococcota bacterium]
MTADAVVSGWVGAGLGAVLVGALVSTALGAGFSSAAGVLGLEGHPWTDAMLLVASVLQLLNFPRGTALGVFGMWVLLAREPRTRFAPPRPDFALVR